MAEEKEVPPLTGEVVRRKIGSLLYVLLPEGVRFWSGGQWHAAKPYETEVLAEMYAAAELGEWERADAATALAAGFERDVAKLNAEGVAARIRARAAERERDEARARAENLRGELASARETLRGSEASQREALTIIAEANARADAAETASLKIAQAGARADIRAEKAEKIAAAERALRIAEVAYVGEASSESTTRAAERRWQAAQEAYGKARDALRALGVEP